MRCFFVSILSYERFRVTYIQRYKYMSALLNLLGGNFIVGGGEGVAQVDRGVCRAQSASLAYRRH